MKSSCSNILKYNLFVNTALCWLQGNCVSVGVTTLTVTASLKDSSGNSVDGLAGNTTIEFSTCWANFTDLSLLNGGTSE